MKKILWVDVGTHYGQEYESAFGPKYKFIFQILKRFIASKFFLRGDFYRLSDIKSIFEAKKFFRKHKSRFKFFFVEANPEIVRKKGVYSNADAVFNFALTANDMHPTSITKLFLGNKDSLSQGSSIFEEKANVNKNYFSTCLGISPSSFFLALKNYFDDEYKDYSVMLRLNCEGVEDEVIYSAHEHFGNRLNLISGSLKDVRDIKGDTAYKNLMDYIKTNNLNFVFFSSNINSWSDAHYYIKRL